MLDEVERGADLVLARLADGERQRAPSPAQRGAGWVVRQGLGLEATTVSSFFRVYRASMLREASARYGDQLIRERGFACKAELLAKLSRARRPHRRGAGRARLDPARRREQDAGLQDDARLLADALPGALDAPEPLPAATEGALGA